jgi:8-oxo-dGTP pyrophosphatase MutT (NUDIX family)
VRFEEVARRLADLPAPLPPSPADLMPVLAAGGSPRLLDEAELRGPGGAPLREAAVLVLLHPDASGEARVVLTERVAYDGHHSAEVSFPGGKCEPGDPDPETTALREAGEEIGLRPGSVSIAGRLDRVAVVVSGHAVTPVLALAAAAPTLAPDPAEVARIVAPPVAAFLPGAPRPVVEREVRGLALRYATYPVDGLEIWGATARILGQLGALLGR